MRARCCTLLFACLVAACVHDDAREILIADADIPPVALNPSTDCREVDGSYQNAGIALRSGVVRNPRLAHSLFRLALPSENGYPRLPSSVRLLVDDASMTLSVTLIGEGVTREWSTPYECRDGWVHVRDTQGKQYLGDGVMQEWATTDVFLAADEDRNLVAHVISASEDRIYLWRKKGSGEGWYLFRRQDAGSRGSQDDQACC